MDGVEHVHIWERRNAYKISVRECEGKRYLEIVVDVRIYVDPKRQMFTVWGLDSTDL